MLGLGVFLVVVFGAWLIFRPRKNVVLKTEEPIEQHDLSKNSKYYLDTYPDLLKTERQPSARAAPPQEPPNIIINITNNHLHEHLHVHLKDEEADDMEV